MSLIVLLHREPVNPAKSHGLVLQFDPSAPVAFEPGFRTPQQLSCKTVSKKGASIESVGSRNANTTSCVKVVKVPNFLDSEEESERNNCNVYRIS